MLNEVVTHVGYYLYWGQYVTVFLGCMHKCITLHYPEIVDANFKCAL